MGVLSVGIGIVEKLLTNDDFWIFFYNYCFRTLKAIESQKKISYPTQKYLTSQLQT